MHILLANFTKMVNDSGGMAKGTCAFANEMVKRGHNVSLVYSDEISGDFYYKIDPNVECYDLSLQNGKRIKFPIHMKIKRELFRLFNNKASSKKVKNKTVVSKKGSHTLSVTDNYGNKTTVKFKIK